VRPCALAHRVAGAPGAPAVVLTGSLGTRRSMWDPQAQALARRFRVVSCDLRGHGDSPVPPGPYSIPELGGDLVALLDRLEIERAHLCGLSIGGMISLWVAAHAPERVERLIVCCTTARFGAQATEAYRERAQTVRALGLESLADGVIARWFTPEFAAACPDVVARMRAELAATPAEGYAACCEALAGLDLTPDLAGITAPTLVLAGERDQATPPEHGEAIAAAVTDGRFAVLADAAHLASVQRPETVTECFERFLSEAAPAVPGS
jgi:3-oxoadipate enol-lactonase